jgi:putative Ca2+/H+ antiporter (TMEM165/GDT1 family)
MFDTLVPRRPTSEFRALHIARLPNRYLWWRAWIGSTVGMVAADALAIGVGRVLGRRLPERAIKYGAAALFAIFGVWLIIDAIAQQA